MIGTRTEKWLGIVATTLIFAGIIVGIPQLISQYYEPVPGPGGVYTEGVIGQPNTPNPILLSTDTDRDLARLLYSGLMRYNQHGSIELDLADSYAISEDGKTYTFALRQDAFFHDGEPLTADDVAFTIRLIQDPAVESPLQSQFENITVKVLDAYTLTFTLEEADAGFVRDALTVGILPEHIWESVNQTKLALSDKNLKPVGSGPFQFKQFIKDNEAGLIRSYSLERFQEHYDRAPLISELEFRYYSNPEDMLADLTKEKIDGIHIIPATIMLSDYTLPESLFTQKSSNTSSVFGLYYNAGNAPALDDKNVRRALGLSLNRNSVARAALYGTHESSTEEQSVGTLPAVTDSPLPAGWLGALPADRDIQGEDDAEARRLLEEAGWTIPEGESVRKNEDRTLSLELVLSEQDPFPAIAEAISTSWQALGVEVTITSLDPTELRTERVRSREYDVLVFGQSIGYDSDLYPFWHSSQRKGTGLNLSSYKNTELDGWLEQARTESDEPRRAELYQQVQQRLLEDMAVTFLYRPQYEFIMRTDYVQNIHVPTIVQPADRFANVHEWYIQTQLARKP